MKHTLLFFLLTSAPTFSNENGASVYLESLKKDNPKLASALEIQEVNQIYTSCFSALSSAGGGAVGGKDIMDCVWNGSNGIAGVSNNVDLKNKVIEAMNENKKNRSVASEAATAIPDKSDEIASNRYEEKAALSGRKKTKSLIALEEHFKTKLQEALYGDRIHDKDKNKLIKTERIVDQSTFFQLFESQLGKNVIASISNYCLSAKNIDSTFFVVYKKNEEREKTIEENLNSLQEEVGGTLIAANNWNKCIGNLQDHCHQPKEKITKQENGEFRSLPYDSNGTFVESIKSACESKDQKKELCNDDDIEYTKQRACETVEYITQARRSLEYTANIQEKLKDLQVAGQPTVNIYHSETAKKNIDEITTVTSNDINSKSNKEGAISALEGANQEINEFKECFENGQIKDQEACKKFLDTNTDEKLAALAEMKLNSEASITELENIIKTGDEEQIVKLLREDGYTEDEAKVMATKQEIKDQILARYKAKEEGILKSAIEEMDKITSKRNDTVDMADTDTLKGIGENLKNKTKEFARLVHFNNIVSGYLSINSVDEDGKKTSKKNTRSILLEMENNVFNEANREVASQLNKDFANAPTNEKVLEEKLKASGYDPEDTERDGASAKLMPVDILKNIIGIFKEKPNP